MLGKFDFVGDLHSMGLELEELLAKLGYGICYVSKKWVHPEGRTLIFTADFLDKGDDPIFVIKTIMKLMKDGIAYSVIGNHDDRLRRYLRDDLAKVPVKVKIDKDFSETIRKINEEEVKNAGFKVNLYNFLQSLPYKLLLDDEIIVVHAAYIPSKKVKVEREIALVGEVDGRKDENGYNIRHMNWKYKFNDPAIKHIVHGHTVMPTVNLTVSQSGTKIWCVDTGAYKGNRLSCLRLPEEEIVSVKARNIHEKD